MLKPHLGDLIYLAIKYMQMTRDQVRSTWIHITFPGGDLVIRSKWVCCKRRGWILLQCSCFRFFINWSIMDLRLNEIIGTPGNRKRCNCGTFHSHLPVFTGISWIETPRKRNLVRLVNQLHFDPSGGKSEKQQWQQLGVLRKKLQTRSTVKYSISRVSLRMSCVLT